MIGGVQNIGRVPELQRRILFTFAMLGVYRIGAHVATPGSYRPVTFADPASRSGRISPL